MGKKRFYKRLLISCLAVSILISSGSVTAQQKKPEVPYVPTPDNVVLEMLKMAQVDKDDLVYDLGCGDGRIVIAAVSKFGCRGVGVDIDPERIKESNENAKRAGVSDRVQFMQMDLFDADISKATVVTLYLLSEVNLRLRPKLLRELSPGTRVVSHAFSMGEWKAEATSSVKLDEYMDPYVQDYRDPFTLDFWDFHTVYFWIVPADVKGTWKLAIPDISGKNDFTLKFDQEFQEARGEAFEGASSIPVIIKDEKLKGKKLQFTLERKQKGRKEIMHFEGDVNPYAMEGTVQIKGSSGTKSFKWTAKRIISPGR
jgi:SAM-dependent methyltransferase